MISSSSSKEVVKRLPSGNRRDETRESSRFQGAKNRVVTIKDR